MRNDPGSRLHLYGIERLSDWHKMESSQHDLLDCVELAPPGKHTHSVIWLHGLGADGNDFPPIVPYLNLPQDHGVRFLFPHAPQIPVTINNGFVMRAWYDITAADLERKVDEEGVRSSASSVQAFIEAEHARGIPYERILLAGFSQGGAIALHLGLRFREKLGGIIALSTYLVLAEKLKEECHPSNKDIPIFQAHGTHDPMVLFTYGSASKDKLTDLGYSVQWKTYPMQHEVCPQEVFDIGEWLREKFIA